MTFIALASRWFLSGGYKVVLGIAAALGLYFFYLHYEHLKSEAALVPGLKAEIASSENRAQILADKFHDIDVKRAAAEAALSAWQGVKTELLNTLKASNRNAAANINPVCLPTATDRKLWNDAYARAIGISTPGSNGSVPGASLTPH